MIDLLVDVTPMGSDPNLYWVFKWVTGWKFLPFGEIYYQSALLFTASISFFGSARALLRLGR
jgi:hypothetical protein